MKRKREGGVRGGEKLEVAAQQSSSFYIKSEKIDGGKGRYN
jgi:hypothetical protein